MQNPDENKSLIQNYFSNTVTETNSEFKTTILHWKTVGYKRE